MKTILVNVKDHLATITLSRPKSNALNKEMILELLEIVEHIEKDEQIAVLIVTGQSPFFSAGLDLIELYQYNEAESEAFWKDFLNLISLLVAFKKPMVTAISGHSPAGGCVLALTADYRIMSDGKYVIGLNEVPVGVVVPQSIFDLYAFWLGKAQAARSLLEGRLFSPAEALNIGLVDELTQENNLLTKAERKAKQYMEFEKNTWSASKLNMRTELIASTQSNQTNVLNQLLTQWWSPATRHILKTIIDNLQQKTRKS